MDEQRFLNACELRDQGKFAEAYEEFIEIAEIAADHPLDKVEAPLFAVKTLEISGQVETATTKLFAVRALMEDHPKSERDERFAGLERFLDFEDANLFWLRGENPEAALNKFEAALKEHRLPLKDPRSRDFYEASQIRRAFILADLGRWKEALPILEGIKVTAGIWRGHCILLGALLSGRGQVRQGKRQIDRSLKTWSADLPRVSRALRIGNDLLQS
jgi:tetratricopeptide (TPR) repeat protein